MTVRLLFLPLLLAGCGGPARAPDAIQTNQAQEVAEKAGTAQGDDGKVECATDGATAFERTCTIERSDSERGRVITLRAPDGGFHRLLITRDGRGVVAADGAEPATVSPLSRQSIEVSIGSDRYRLDALVRQ